MAAAAENTNTACIERHASNCAISRCSFRLLHLTSHIAPLFSEEASTTQATSKPQLTIMKLTTMVVALVAALLPIASAANITQSIDNTTALVDEHIPNLQKPCDCKPANCPVFLSSKSVSRRLHFKACRLGSLILFLIQKCHCQNAAAQACYTAANGGCPKPVDRVGDLS